MTNLLSCSMSTTNPKSNSNHLFYSLKMLLMLPNLLLFL
jgi:hypothetical protein